MVRYILNIVGENIVTLYFMVMCIYYFVKRKNRETYTILFFTYFLIDLLRKTVFYNFIEGKLIAIIVAYSIEVGTLIIACFLYFKKSRERKKLSVEREWFYYNSIRNKKIRFCVEQHEILFFILVK